MFICSWSGSFFFCCPRYHLKRLLPMPIVHCSPCRPKAVLNLGEQLSCVKTPRDGSQTSTHNHRQARKQRRCLVPVASNKRPRNRRPRQPSNGDNRAGLSHIRSNLCGRGASCAIDTGYREMIAPETKPNTAAQAIRPAAVVMRIQPRSMMLLAAYTQTSMFRRPNRPPKIPV